MQIKNAAKNPAKNGAKSGVKNAVKNGAKNTAKNTAKNGVKNGGLPPCYVLDTNVLLHDPDALYAFADAEVVAPISVIEEIDRFKAEMSEKGRNARLVSTALDSLRTRGSLAKGVRLDNQGRLRVHVWYSSPQALSPQLEARRPGNQTLACALDIHAQAQTKVILVSQDVNTRVKAHVLGLEAAAYEASSALSNGKIYSGCISQQVSAQKLQSLASQQHLTSSSLGISNPFPNQGVITTSSNGKPPLLLRYHADKKTFLPLKNFCGGVWGLQPCNPAQALALDMLLDAKISIVTLLGKAGTGKTLLALAAGLQQMMDDNTYRKMLISRPIFPMGKDIGYLPGSAQEKLEPWMQPIFDNLSLLIQNPVSHQSQGYQPLIEQGLISIEPLTYIRGRSIPNQFLLVDEAQNLTPHEIKTIITRVGEGTKIVLTGDPQQIDNPYLDLVSNGLSHVVERLRSHAIAGHVTLSKGERSPLAELAANIL